MLKKITHKLCKSCKYYGVTIGCCDYAEMTGKLRTIKDRQVVLPNGYCDKYELFEPSGDRSAERRAIWMDFMPNHR